MGGLVSKLSYYFANFFPAKPTFTEKECPDQSGKVFIVTGGYVGVGFELCKILYEKNGTVYVAGRTESKATKAIETIKAAHPRSTGKVEFLLLDLGDLTTIERSANQFLSKEQRLDVLWNNAGVMMPAQGSKTEQGYEMQLGTNCLGPYLFTKKLLPVLQQTAKSSPTASVRVCWASSSAMDFSPAKHGINIDDLHYKKDKDKFYKYAQSKTGNNFIAHQFAEEHASDGIISVSFNPGNLKSELQRHLHPIEEFVLKPFLYHARYGAYTELYCGLSPEVTPDKNGDVFNPWGVRNSQIRLIRPDIAKAFKRRDEGGTGGADDFYQWVKNETAKY